MTQDGLSSEQTLTIDAAKPTSSPRSGGIMRHVSNILSGNKKQNHYKASLSPSSSVLKLPKSVASLARSNSKTSLVSSSYSASVNDYKPSPSVYAESFAGVPASLTPTAADFVKHTHSNPLRRDAVVQRDVVAVVGPFPQEVVNAIISYVPRRSLPAVARTSRAFCKAARSALYTTVDVRFIRSARFEQLCILLASNSTLANLIETFTYHTWHPSFFQRTGKSTSRARDTRISLLTSATATLAGALKNMHNLQTITLPSFNAYLMQDVLSPVLQRVTFFNHSLSAEEHRELRFWLSTQPGLLSLSFPNLFEKDSTPDPSLSAPFLAPSTPGTPEMTPPATPQLPNSHPSSNPPPPHVQRLHSSRPSPTSPGFASAPSEQSGTILPVLQSLNAPPSLATFLLATSSQSTSSLPTPPPSSRSTTSVDIPRNGSSSGSAASVTPLKRMTLQINSTLYTGLRPSSLMQCLASRGTASLVLRFSDDMDRRTVEKVLGAAGSVLGQITTKKRPFAALETLEAEVGNTGIWSDDDVLYRIVSSVISRFRSLRTLRLRYAASRPRITLSSPSSAANSTDSLPLSIRSMTTTASRPTINTLPPPSILAYDEYPPVVLTDTEHFYVSTWVKQCPTLCSVVLLSGAEWQPGLYQDH